MSFPSRKKHIQKWVRLPRPKQDLETQTTYVFKLRSEDSQLGEAYDAFQVWWRPVSCEARTRGSGEVLCAKSMFFLVQAANRNDPSPPPALLAGFSTMTCFVFLVR